MRFNSDKQFNSGILGKGLAQQLKNAQKAASDAKSQANQIQLDIQSGKTSNLLSSTKASANTNTTKSAYDTSSAYTGSISDLMGSMLSTWKGMYTATNSYTTSKDKSSNDKTSSKDQDKTKYNNPKNNCAPPPPKCAPTPPPPPPVTPPPPPPPPVTPPPPPVCPPPPVTPPPPPPPPVTPPPPPPPPPSTPQVMGAAGLFGDPKFGVFTPGLDANIVSALGNFDSGITNGQTVTLLQDGDKGGFKVSGTGVQVDPANVNSTGIGTASFESGADKVTINGDGSLLINGTAVGNINADTIGTRTLANGMTVSVSNEVDNAAGGTAKRFVIQNGEYKVTAAVRKPHPDSAGYLDMNFEERTADAADNATGFKSAVTEAGIAELLRLEPGDGNLVT